MLQKIKDTRAFLNERGYGHVEIEVDGNVSFENIPKMKQAGANVFVLGTSAVFSSAMPMQEAIAKTKQLVYEIQ